MRKSILRSTLLAAALGCTSLAFAATPQATTSGGTTTQQGTQAQHQPSLFDELNLTDTQRSSVRQLLQQSVQSARAQMQSLHPQQLALENATPGTAAYQTATNALAQAESSAAHDQVLRQADLRAKIYNLLTAEQRTKLIALRDQRRQQMEQRAQQMQQQQRSQSSAPDSSSR